MKRIIILFTILSLYIYSPLLNKIGYTHGQETGRAYFKILPSTYIVSIGFGLIVYVYIYKLKYLYNNRRNGFNFLFICLLIYLFLLFTGRGNAIAFIADTLISSALISIMLPKRNFKLNRTLNKIILCFLSVNSLMAILERLLNRDFFPPSFINVLSKNFEDGFRATALLGHPLNNGFITVVIMGFLYLSNHKQRLMLLFLGGISLLCFGARGAIYVFLSLTILHLLGKRIISPKRTFKLRKNQKQTVYSFLLIASGLLLLYVLLFYTKFGDRLMSVSLFDQASAGTRLKVFDMLKYFNYNDLLWGASQNTINNAMSKIDLNIIENFWLQWVLRFGLILSILMTVSIVTLMYKQLYYLRNNEKLYLIALFFMVASTNNSLATSTTALSTFILCCAAFNIHTYKKYKRLI